MGTLFFLIMTNENYIVVLGWMVNELKLSGNELLCYALIYGFSQDQTSEFTGSHNYIAESLNTTRENARKILLRLIEKGLINKRDEVISGVKFCRYSISAPCIKTVQGGTLNQCMGVHQNSAGGYAKTAHNNINNNLDNNAREEEEEKETFSLGRSLGLDPKSISVDSRVFSKVEKLLSHIVFPFEDDEFKRKFFILCCMPKWRNKTVHAIQMQLTKLQKYDMRYVLELIDASIMNEWQGLIYSDTDKKYNEWLKKSKFSGNDDMKDALEYLKL